MPNWCQNEVNISGPLEDVRAFLTAVGYAKGSEVFSFDGILPKPKELTGIMTGVTTIDGIQYETWREVDGVSIPLLDKELEDIYNRCGATDNIEWCCKYWGTKWDAQYVEYLDVHLDDPTAHVLVHFDTAWGPPQELYDYCCEKFPTVGLSWFYREDGMQIAGWLFEGGEV